MLHHYIEYVTWGFATQCEERETRRSITCVLFWNFPPFHLSFSGPCRHFPGSSVKFLRFCSLVTLLAERRLGMNSSPTIPPPSTDRIVKQHADTCEYLQSSTTRRRKWGLWEVQFVLAIWKSSLRTMTSFDDGRQPAKPTLRNHQESWQTSSSGTTRPFSRYYLLWVYENVSFGFVSWWTVKHFCDRKSSRPLCVYLL